MPSFFFTGDAAGISDGDVSTIVGARNEAVAARDAAQAAYAQVQAAAGSSAQAVADAQAAALAAQAVNSALPAQVQAAKDWATKTDVPVDGTSYGAQFYATQAAGAADQAAQSGSVVAQAVLDAQAAQGLAQQWASGLTGVEVTPGLESARSYAQRAQSAAATAIAMPAKNLLDADFSGGNYTLKRADLGFLLRCKNTTAGTILLPAGLWTGPGPTGGSSNAPVRVVKRGAGTVAFSGAGSSVIAPGWLADQLFLYSVTTVPASYSPTHSFIVPAGTGRKLTLFLFSIHDTSGARTIGMSVSGTGVSGLTKTVSETGTGWYNDTAANTILGAQWTASIADGAQVTVTISPTLDHPNAYALWAMATNNVSATAGAAGAGGTGSASGADVTRTLTPVEASDMLMFGLAQVGPNTLPVTLGGGSVNRVQAQNGKTPLSRSTKDICFIFGYDVVPSTTAQSYTLTGSLATPTCSLGLILKPGTASSVTVNGSPGTMSTVGQMADILADDDGVTYDVRLM